MDEENIGIVWNKKCFDEESQKNTPDRIKRFMQELKDKQDFKFTVFDNDKHYNDMVILKNINFMSFCSHHLLPFTGIAHVGYIPAQDGKICGISKLARTVDKFASMPQLQERMTYEIANFLVEKLEPEGVIVVVEATHMCISERGVKKTESIMITSAVRGIFKTDENVKEEFLKLIKG
jgi:GTP cyclohydrolase I